MQMPYSWLIYCALASSATAQLSNYIPSQFAVQDAPSHLWVPGATGGIRMQTLIGAPQVAALGQGLLTGLAFRRSTRDEDFAGTTVQMVVRLSTSTTAVDLATPSFSNNHGADLTTVFAGTVNIPASPRTTSTQIAWDASNSIPITFQIPFTYVPGRTLCIDIEGMPTSAPLRAWAADATIESAAGQSTSIGIACGPYAQSDGRWSFVDEATLLAGGRARFHAFGTPSSPALVALSGAAQANALDLTPLGFPGCQLHVATPLSLNLTFFGDGSEPYANLLGARASFELGIPNATWALGTQLAAQWLDIGAAATSNAVAWTISSQPPSLDMAVVTGFHDGTTPPVSGMVSRQKVHVLRLDWQ